MKQITRRVFVGLLALCALGLLRADPLQILEVDASNYPQIRMRLALKAIHPNFIQNNPNKEEAETSRKGGLALKVSEIYQNQEFPVEARVRQSSPFDGPLQAVLLIDATRSLSARHFRKSKELARRFLEGLSAKDRSVVYALKARPLLVADVSRQHKEQIEKLNQIKRNGKKTRLYDGLYSALYTAHSLQKNASKTVVLLFTDAKEESSFLSDNDCLELSRIGKELSIPVYTILAKKAKGEARQNHRKAKQQGKKTRKNIRKKHKKKTGILRRRHSQTEIPSAKHRLTEERLRRIALKTGGQVWLLDRLNRTPERTAAFREIRRSAAFKTELFWSRPETKPKPWPGDKVLIRVSLKQGEADYAALASYRVPFGAYMRSEYGSSSILIAFLTASLVLFLIFLLLVIILVSIWIRRLPKDATEEKTGPQPMRFLKKKREEDPLKNLAGYVGENTDALPEQDFETLGEVHPAPILMEDERRLYMREYNYRLLQLALREAGRYEKGAALVVLSAPETKEGRRYDLFLESTVIGSGRWANIPLHDNTASPIHAKIKRVDGRYVLYDMLSAGGVYRNGKKLLRPRGLRNGDEIRIGRSKFRFAAGAGLAA